jgi:hypothetical protein
LFSGKKRVTKTGTVLAGREGEWEGERGRNGEGGKEGKL